MEQKKLRNLVLLALFIALIFLLGQTPLGLIPLGWCNVTLLVIPVAVGTLYMGLKNGLILGLAFGWFLLLVHLAGLTSFGISYLMPYGGETGTNTAGWRDALIRYPMKEQWWRPLWARPEKRRRMTKKKGGASR